jgi:hypothetical protein
MKTFGLILVFALAAGGLALATYNTIEHRRLSDRLAASGDHGRNDAPGTKGLSDADRDRRLEMIVRAQESPWVGGDGPIQVRLTAEMDEYLPPAGTARTVRVLAEVRNASGQPQTVSGMLFFPVTIHVSCDGKPLRCLGPKVAVAPGGRLVLPPGRIAREWFDLTPDAYDGFGQPGSYVAEWYYASGYGDTRLTWSGSMPVARTSWLVR